MSRSWSPRRFVARRRARVIIAAAVVVMLFMAAFLIGGRKTVSIEVNGETRQVSTYAMSVDRLLESEGVRVKSHDLVDSTSGKWLSDHAIVTVRSAYQVELTIDGARVPYWTVAQSVDQLLSFFNQANDRANAITVNITDIYNQLTGGLVINKEGPVKVIADGKESIAPNGKLTAASILDSKGITMGKDDRVNVEEDGDMPTLRVQRVTYGQEHRDVDIDFETVTVVNDSLKPGESRVASEGVKGVKQQTYDVTYVDGKADSETLVSEVITKQPQNRVIEVGPAKSSKSDTDSKKTDSSKTGTDSTTGKADSNKSNKKDTTPKVDTGKTDSGTGSNAGSGTTETPKKDTTSQTTPKEDTTTPSTGGDQSNNDNGGTSDTGTSDNSQSNGGATGDNQSNGSGTDSGNTGGNTGGTGGSTGDNSSSGNTGNSGSTDTGNSGNTGGNSGSTDTGGTGTPTGSWHLNPTQAKALARGMMRDYYGWGDDQYNCLVPLWEHESNWLWYAENASSGAYGIPQALPPDKMGEGWHDDVAVQISWGLSYFKDNPKYGTPCGAWTWWQANKWY